ncbi:hypothetical protein AURDEDRAFT_163856 [Auricularia subglabra TFB-10046 SS5]|nr:hypothetical protein AURDEDRAFT_163856 [Auricularia subglabra TFB-10046 SS5]
MPPSSSTPPPPSLVEKDFLSSFVGSPRFGSPDPLSPSLAHLSELDEDVEMLENPGPVDQAGAAPSFGGDYERLPDPDLAHYGSTPTTTDNAPLEMPMRSAARGESPAVRYAYLSAAVNRTFRGQTCRQAEQGLRDMLGLVDMTGGLPADSPAPATTLVSTMRRLRLDPDESIIRYAACPICWRMFSPMEFTDSLVPQRALNAPAPIVPYVSIVESLRRMMLRPGFADRIRDSRNVDLAPYDDPDFVKEGMHHGLVWHTQRTRTRRMFGRNW